MSMHYDFFKQIRSFKYAWKGWRTCLGHEQNLSFHLIATAVVVAAGCWFQISSKEWIAVVICIGMVISAELFNSAIERLVDLVSPTFNPIAGQVKDIAAGAVLVLALAAAIVGCIIFFPYIFHF